jgi:hypothetical protein
LAKILCLNLILHALFQSAQHLNEEREGSGSIPLTNGSGSGRPKNADPPDPNPNTGKNRLRPRRELRTQISGHPRNVQKKKELRKLGKNYF